jgi:hypothetical protein
VKPLRSARLAVLLTLAAGATAVLIGPPLAHAAVPECTDADRSNGSGLQIANGQASITFTLSRDCTIGLTAYEVRGSDQTKFDTAVANTAGTHTLTVALPPCFQVDFHPGPVHNRGEGKAIRWAKDCKEGPPPPEEVGSPPTTVPSGQPPAGPPANTAESPPSSPPGPPPPNTDTVLPLVLTPAAAPAELPATGSRLAGSVALALIGLGLGFGALTAGHWRGRRLSGGEADR